MAVEPAIPAMTSVNVSRPVLDAPACATLFCKPQRSNVPFSPNVSQAPYRERALTVSELQWGTKQIGRTTYSDQAGGAWGQTLHAARVHLTVLQFTTRKTVTVCALYPEEQ